MTGTDVLNEPDVLRALGRGEYHRDAFAALALGQIRRTMQSLTLVQRRCDPTVQAECDAAWLIGRWIQLARAGRPAAIGVLRDPFVAIWASGVVAGRREVGEVGAIARLLSAEVGADERWSTSLSCDGALTLARCGGRLVWAASAPDCVVELSLAESRLTVSTGGGSATFDVDQHVFTSGEIAWQPIPRVASTLQETCLDLELTDADPLAAAVGRWPVERLDAVAGNRWSAAVGAAWNLVVTRHRTYFPGVAEVCRVLVPQRTDDPVWHVSSSSAEGFGAIAMSFTEDVPTMAVALIHETQHLKLNALLDVVQLHCADEDARYYAGWRDDPRSFQALLHGVYAFSAVTEFWKAEYLAQPDAPQRLRYGFEFALWAAQTTASLQELRAAGVVTPAGGHFLAGISEIACGWDVPVEPIVSTAVADVMAEHRLGWELRASGSTRRLDTGLRRAWQMALTGLGPVSPQSVVHPIDEALVAGDHHRALRLARAELERDGADPSNAFRFSRARLHAGLTRRDDELGVGDLATTSTDHTTKAGCP